MGADQRPSAVVLERSGMLETVSGEEAARLFAEHLKLQGRGIGFLRELAYHLAEFPYENISKILKAAQAPTLAEAMRLPTEVVADHIDRHFGGTCFSLTFLFERMLMAFGFDCSKVMADMHSGRNVHCLVIVQEGGRKYMVDPGYALYEVIELPGAAVGAVRGAAPRRARAELPHATVEVARTESICDVSTEDASGRKWRYRFADWPTPDAQFEQHWLESFAKPTLHNICLTRMTPRGHIYIRKDFFKFTSPTAIEKRRLASGGRERLIEQEFGIAGEWVEAAQQILDTQRLAARG
jgi:arylamine N-acetyltransferase